MSDAISVDGGALCRFPCSCEGQLLGIEARRRHLVQIRILIHACSSFVELVVLLIGYEVMPSKVSDEHTGAEVLSSGQVCSKD